MSLIIFFAVVAIIAVGILIMGGPWMQRLVIANLFGIALVAVATTGAALFITVSQGWQWSSWAFPWMLGSGFLTLIDLGYRYLGIRSKQVRQADQENGSSSSLRSHWLTPGRGASLIIFPAWIVGAVTAVVFAVLSVLDLLWQARQSFPG